jgi:hypothetical protein
MALKYGDVVVKVQKSRGKDGEVIVTRVNAIVLSSVLKQPLGADRKPQTDAAGKKLAPVEHIDLAFPDPGLVPEGQSLKTRNVDSIFRLAYDVKPWAEDAQIGFELGPTAENHEDLIEALGASRDANLQIHAELEAANGQVVDLTAKLAAIPLERSVGQGAQEQQ